MVKFSDFKNENPDADNSIDKMNIEKSSQKDSLSFRKLLCNGKVPSPKAGVSEQPPVNKARSGKKGKSPYKKAYAYLSEVFKAIKERKTFSLEPGFKIIEEIVDFHSRKDSLFIQSIHFDSQKQYIIGNNVNVAIYAIKIAENLGWDRKKRVEIGMCGLLHDIGMGLIPEKLLHKQDKLSEIEFKIFKERANYSYKILKVFKDGYAYLAECALQVNERIDGSGYPSGLRGDEIHEYAQIIGLVDMYEALIHSRPQREKFLHFSAVKEIIKEGKNKFQRKHLKALLNIFSIFPLYSYVRLNSNAVGKVIETYPDQPMRPKLQIVYDSQYRKVLTERVVNLQENPLLYIVDSIYEEELEKIPTIQTEDSQKKHRNQVLKSEDLRPSDYKEFTGDHHEINVEKDKHKYQAKKTVRYEPLKTGLLVILLIASIAFLIIQFKNKELAATNSGKVKLSSFSRKIPSVKQKDIHNKEEKPVKNEVKLKKNNDTMKHETVSHKELTDKKDFGQTTVETIAPMTVKNTEKDIILKKEFDKKIKTLPTDTVSKIINYPYSIKLASFPTRDEAEKSLDFYRKKRLFPYWVKVNLGKQGTWYRVFAGHFKNIKQAQEKLKALNLKDGVVKKTNYSVLIGTYSSETALNLKLKMISEKGYSPYFIKTDNGQFNLYVGAFYTYKGAENQNSDLIAKGIKSRIVER